MDKKKAIWAVAFVFIAGASIWAVMSQAKGFSIETFLEYIQNSNPAWLCAAVISMLGYVVFEGLAIHSITSGLGHKRKVKSNFLYSAADIYFSAITPSATGGQPASAYFMMKDGIPTAVVTVSLLVNLVMYTAALLTTGLLCLIIAPGVFMNFSTLSRMLIIAGYILQIVLGAAFILLLFRGELLEKIFNKLFKLLDKLKIMNYRKKRQKKLQKTMEDFRECANMISELKPMLGKAFAYNFLQRLSQILVTVFVFLATYGGSGKVKDIFVTQCFVVLGSNCVPIPGAMGVADYLMLDGFGSIMSQIDATNLELLSRSLSFYVLIIISGITVLVGYILRRIKRSKV